MRFPTRLLALPAVCATVVLLAAAPARAAGPVRAFAPVDVVHTEKVEAGPYNLTVGFSTWPLRALQSLDFTFTPAGGIAGKSGTFTLTGDDVNDDLVDAPLVRHPRDLATWGLDIVAIEAAGTYDLTFTVDGPEGTGTGTLHDLTVLEQPGPPLALSWSLAGLPLFGLAGLIGTAWRRGRPREGWPAL